MTASLKDLIFATERELDSFVENLKEFNELQSTIQRRIKNLAYNLTVGDSIRDKDCARMADALSEYQEISEEITDLEEKIRMAEEDLENLREELAEEE